MDIFKRKPKKELPPLIADEELIDYNSVLNYLIGLSPDDYAKVCQVATIYRTADQEAAAALGVANEPATFIHPPKPTDELAPFLEDEPKKSKKIAVKSNGKLGSK